MSSPAHVASQQYLPGASGFVDVFTAAEVAVDTPWWAESEVRSAAGVTAVAVAGFVQVAVLVTVVTGQR